MKSQGKRGNRLRLLAGGVGVVVLMGAAACATTVDDGAQEKERSAQSLTAESARHHRGPVSVVIDAARTHGNLSAKQERTLGTIVAELEEDRDSRRELHENLRTSAVAVVRSGTTDTEEFDRAVSQAVRAIEQRLKRNASALEEIHAILKPDQRAAVAVALRAHIAEKLGPRRDDEKRQRDGFKRIASHLMLSAFQIDKLKAMKKELLGEKESLRPSSEELDELVDAFEGENFPAALDTFHVKKTALLRDRFAHAGERTDTVLSLLTDAQRDLLADLIQDGPSKVLLGDKGGQEPGQGREN